MSAGHRAYASQQGPGQRHVLEQLVQVSYRPARRAGLHGPAEREAR